MDNKGAIEVIEKSFEKIQLPKEHLIRQEGIQFFIIATCTYIVTQ